PRSGAARVGAATRSPAPPAVAWLPGSGAGRAAGDGVAPPPVAADHGAAAVAQWGGCGPAVASSPPSPVAPAGASSSEVAGRPEGQMAGRGPPERVPASAVPPGVLGG